MLPSCARTYELPGKDLIIDEQFVENTLDKRIVCTNMLCSYYVFIDIARSNAYMPPPLRINALLQRGLILHQIREKRFKFLQLQQDSETKTHHETAKPQGTTTLLSVKKCDCPHFFYFNLYVFPYSTVWTLCGSFLKRCWFSVCIGKTFFGLI